jgi:hypothetical protein
MNFGFGMGFFDGQGCRLHLEGGAGLLLLTLARVLCCLYFLSLLAPVRGGTSFLGPSPGRRQRNEAKKTPFHNLN